MYESVEVRKMLETIKATNQQLRQLYRVFVLYTQQDISEITEFRPKKKKKVLEAGHKIINCT